MFENTQCVIVGAGFFGAVMAERIANDAEERVVILERRHHVGGNSASVIDPETRIEIHCHGSHIFHTSNESVWHYITQFTGFNNYRHKVLATHAGKVYPIPINLSTINRFYGRNFTSEEARMFLDGEIDRALRSGGCSGFEMAFLSKTGRPLYEAFIKGYTTKQWGEGIDKLPIAIAQRIPVRCNHDGSYFDDRWQGIPVNGYAALFDRLLQSERIDLYLGVDFFNVQRYIPKKCLIIYSGALDRFFGYKYGRLGWRSLKFSFETVANNNVQDTAVMNYPDIDVPYTRIHEFRHLHAERSYASRCSIICREYPMEYGTEDEPYYPIRSKEDIEKLSKYAAEPAENHIFGGRLGSYAYLNMDQVIEQALSLYERKVKPRLLSRRKPRLHGIFIKRGMDPGSHKLVAE
ncbi:MAG: UDP-galactopyranose mutase [Magnetococcales bacterium]|nr:UDP-galactopyranose mutase [Magnetococcales bacterium]